MSEQEESCDVQDAITGTDTDPNNTKGKLRFKIGVALIVMNYAFFGLTFVFGGLAVAGSGLLVT